MTHPRTEALAYRIWAYATPREWNVTGKDIAEALGVTYQLVAAILQVKGWVNRTRSNKMDYNGFGPLHIPENGMDRGTRSDMGLDRPNVNE